jgi:hypothetical protein
LARVIIPGHNDRTSEGGAVTTTRFDLSSADSAVDAVEPAWCWRP